MGQLNLILAERLDIHDKPVILRSNFHLAGFQIHNRMVAAAMPELELRSRPAKSLTENLVAETHAKNRLFAEKLAHGLYNIRHRGRIAGAVGEENTVGFAGQYIRGLGKGRDHFHLKTVLHKLAQNIFLDAAIQRLSLESFFPGIPAAPLKSLEKIFAEFIRFLAGHFPDKIYTHDTG